MWRGELKMSFYPEMWGNTLINDLARRGLETPMLSNFVTDYTDLVEGERVSAYNGPLLGSLTAVAINGSTTAQDVTKSVINIPFDQMYGTPINVPNIEVAQSNVNILSKYTTMSVDAHINNWNLAIINAAIAAKAPTALSTSGITEDEIIAQMKALNIANAPLSDRYMFVGPEIHASLFSIANFRNAMTIGNTDAIGKGIIAEFYGFKVVLLNNMPKVSTKEVVVFTHKSGIGFGRQQAIDIKTQVNALTNVDIINFITIFGVKAQLPEFIICKKQV